MKALPLIQPVLALALALAVPVAAWMLAAAPLLDAYDAVERRLDTTVRLLARQQAIARTRQPLEVLLEGLRERVDGGGAYMHAASAAIAAADLQGRLKALVTRHGGAVQSVQTLRLPDPDSGPPRVAVRMALEADTPALRAILHAIESGRPILLVEELDVRAQGPAGSGEGQRLAVRLEVRGLLRPDSGAGGA